MTVFCLVPATRAENFTVLLTAISSLIVAGIPTVIPLTTLFYNGTKDEFEAVFNDFLALSATTTILGPLSYNDITKVLPPGSERTNGVSRYTLAFMRCLVSI